MARERSFLPYIVVSLFALTLAATTGVLLRFGMIFGMPDWAQNFGAVRHAHSHLMYFGWVTLALMAFIWSDLPNYTGRPLPQAVHWQMLITAIFALLSYPAFWSNGYGLTQIGSAHLPLGSMVSTFNGLTWFFFVGLYVKATSGLPERPLCVQLWDWAIALMLLAALGAVGLVGMVISHADNPFLQQLFLHQFLDLFAVGWFNLALLGVIWSKLGAQTTLPRWLPSMSLALLIAPTFVLGMTPTVVPNHLFWIAALANLAVAVLLSVHLVAIWRRRKYLPRFALLGFAALAVTVAAAVSLLIPGLWSVGAGGQLRIFYLHDILLGWVSTLLIVLVEAHFISTTNGMRRLVNGLWGVGVVAMLAALLALGSAAVLPVPALLTLQIAAWASIPVAGAALLLFVSGCQLLWRRRSINANLATQELAL
jgi:hypothetical protein